MKTIEERAKSAWFNYEYHEGYLYEKVFCDGYAQGVQSEHEELTRWRDPRKELPPLYDNIMVKYMASDRCENIAIVWRSAGDAGGYNYTISGTSVTMNSRDVLGWRPIHE